MITFEILEADAVVVVKPSGPLSEGDFQGLAEGVDHYLESHDGLSGLMIEVQQFPGWENFSGLVQHIKFVRKHHEIIQRVALVTDIILRRQRSRLRTTLFPRRCGTFRSKNLRTLSVG